MKSTIIWLAAFLIISVSINAQPRITPKERLKMLNERLNLTEEQSVKIEKILKTSDEEIQKLRESEKPDRTEFRKIMDHTNQEIMTVLNEKQKTEYNKMLEERRNRWRKSSNNKDQ
jgi:Spy/CpxP family protein refolding chaperone